MTAPGPFSEIQAQPSSISPVDPAAVGDPPPSHPAARRTVLLSGNEAIARGAREAGVRVAAGYPGTPSTEILEALVRLDPGRQVYVEWATN